MSIIVQLPGVRLNPLAMLDSVMVAKPDAVVTLSRTNDEWHVGWSNMSVQELVYAMNLLRVKVDALLLNGREE